MARGDGGGDGDGDGDGTSSLLKPGNLRFQPRRARAGAFNRRNQARGANPGPG